MLRRRLEPLIEDLDLSHDDRDAVVVLLSSAVLLLLFSYWGRPSFYASSGIIDRVRSLDSPTLADLADAGAYVWWGLSSILLRVVAPLAIGVWVLKWRPSDLGYRLKGIGSHLWMYGLAYVVMLPVLVWVSGFDSFSTYYPFYERAAEGGLGFWVYEVGYAFQFVGVEAFFRGFMTFGLFPRFGYLAVPIMTIPYTMIHFVKPAPEAAGAIVAGLVLGYLALKSKSFVPGIFLHVGVAVTMDLLVLGRAGALGSLL